MKVSDFGLAQDVYEEGHYKAEESEAVPVRWMSMEAIQFSVFTTSSDVVHYILVFTSLFV